MNISINDEDFINSKSYIDFLANNPGRGMLKIRSYAANQAIPVRGLNIVISTPIGGNNVIFYEGSTNESGVIEGISLPTPRIDNNDLVVPKGTTYDIKAYLTNNQVNKNYKVNLYDGVSVIQNISIAPDYLGDISGS